MQYETYQRNYVLFPGSEKPLHSFLNTILKRNGQEEKHKLKHAFSPNSEDALTWSCFDVLRHQPYEKIVQALSEIVEDAFDGNPGFSFGHDKNIQIHIGKHYYASTVVESTELDASIETDDKLIFIEAKLYSKISLPDTEIPHDQIARKLRVGLDVAKRENKVFYFIFLDIAPINYTLKFGEKAINAEQFKLYKENSGTLASQLIENSYNNIEEVSQNMGWLTWASLFKTVLRAVIK